MKASLNQSLQSLSIQPDIIEVMAMMRFHRPTSDAVCGAGVWAIQYLAEDDVVRAHLRNRGACEGSNIQNYITLAASPAKVIVSFTT
jgi:hypothetical protein